MKHTVKIIETLVKEIEIEAASEQEAIDKAEKMYKDEEIVLYADDWESTEYEIVS